MRICMMSLMMGDSPVEEIVSVAQACGMEAIDWIGLHGRTAKELKKLCLVIYCLLLPVLQAVKNILQMRLE